MTSAWLVPYQEAAAPATRLFCLPYAGAGASVFRRWRLRERHRAQVWAVRLPGRESRYAEPPPQAWPATVEQLTAAMLPLLDVPFVLFGHSMGALLAFEVLRRLPAATARRCALLAVGAHRAPHRPPTVGIRSTLPDRALVARVLDSVGATERPRMERELVEALLPTIRADLAFSESHRYDPGPPLAVPVATFAAVDDPDVRVEDVRAWAELTTGGSRHTLTRGGHLFLRDHPDLVLRQIDAVLGRLTAAAVGP